MADDCKFTGSSQYGRNSFQIHPEKQINYHSNNKKPCFNHWQVEISESDINPDLQIFMESSLSLNHREVSSQIGASIGFRLDSLAFVNF